MMLSPLTRMNEHFLLGDFLYNDTVIRCSVGNAFDFKTDSIRFTNGKILADSLSKVSEEHGQLSISYGYIAPELSVRIVKYQDPGKPSYHRWDLGAAADIIVHRHLGAGLNTAESSWVHNPHPKHAPVLLASSIARSDPAVRRLITYSESPVVCVGVKNDNYAMSKCTCYENRYVSDVRPKFINHGYLYPLDQELTAEVGRYGWVGHGYPQYHGGGRRQYHHVRVHRLLMLSDCLRAPDKLVRQLHNRPPNNTAAKQNFMNVAEDLGEIINRVQWITKIPQISIVAGYGARFGWVNEAFTPFDDLSDWTKGVGGMILAISGEEPEDTVVRLMEQLPQVFVAHQSDGSWFLLIKSIE